MQLRQKYGFAALAWAAACGIAAASPIEHAVDTTGAVGAVPITFGDHTLNAALAGALEVDSYTFSAQAGDSIRLQLHSFTAGLDPELTLRGPDGSIVRQASCSGNFGSSLVACSALLDASLTMDGVYTLNVADTGRDESGSYQLHLETYPPVNNWVGVPYATPVLEVFGHTTDIDAYAFNVVAGTGVQVTVASRTPGLDLILQVWDEVGTLVANTACSGNFGSSLIQCTALADLTSIGNSGVYRVALLESGADETGGYTLQVSCLFGACPVAVPAVPEPGSWALLAAGLGAVGTLARRRRMRAAA